MNIIPIIVLGVAGVSLAHGADSESVLDQLSQNIYDTKKYGSGSIEDEALFAPSSDGDSDLGEQLVLKRSPNQSPLRVYWDAHVIHSNNVTNSNVATQNGVIFSSRFEANWLHHMKNNWFANVAVSQSFYQYENNVDLDFSNTITTAGLVKILSDSDVVLSMDLVHNYARQNFLSDKIHAISSLRVGASKTFHHSTLNSSYMSLNYSVDLDSSSVTAERDALNLRLGHTRTMNDSLRVIGFADVSKFDYDSGGRDDTTIAIGVSVEYAFTANVQLYTSLSYIDNDSSVVGLDYKTTLGSLGVGLKATF